MGSNTHLAEAMPPAALEHGRFNQKLASLSSANLFRRRSAQPTRALCRSACYTGSATESHIQLKRGEDIPEP